MANYQSQYTGAQIDEAVGKALSSSGGGGGGTQLYKHTLTFPSSITVTRRKFESTTTSEISNGELISMWIISTSATPITQIGILYPWQKEWLGVYAEFRIGWDEVYSGPVTMTYGEDGASNYFSASYFSPHADNNFGYFEVNGAVNDNVTPI